MESPSTAKESCPGQVCVRGVPAWRSREAIVWSCEGKAWIALGTPRCWRCQTRGILTKESCRLGMESTQEREVCFSQQTWTELEIWTLLTWDMEGDTECGAFPAVFWSCFSLLFPHGVPFSPFWNDKIYSTLLYVVSMWSAFDFDCLRITVRRLPWVSEGILEF
jgi:hypothetical protein